MSFLRSPLANPAEQAKLALAYVRHVESSDLAWLQMGRTASDATLTKEVTEMRLRLTKISEAKAKQIVEAQIESEPEVPPA
jgi:hypothetical protein